MSFRLNSFSQRRVNSVSFDTHVDALETRRLLAAIASTTPYNGQQQFGVTANLTVRFSGAMNIDTLNSDTVRLFDAAGNSLPATYDYATSTNTLTVDPVQNLASTSSYYMLRVVGGTGGVKDSTGGALPEDREVSFTTGTPNFNESIVFAGLNNPTAVEFADDGRIFVAEKRGVIKVYDSLTDTTPDIFADLRTKVHNYWDRGLLGLTLDPNFTNGRPYVYALYTYDGDLNGNAPKWGTANTDSDPGSSDGSTTVSGRLSKFTASGNVMTGGEQVLIHDWQNQFPSHSIGDLSFGPDGFLYASSGDGASFGVVDFGQINSFNDPVNEGGAVRSQDIRSTGDPVGLDGTIIRIDPDTGAGASSNPYSSSSDNNAKRIISYGLRNPYRFTFRPGTSEIWIAETGWNDYEEINRITNASDTAVENFGWPAYEGPNRQPGYDSANLPLLESLYAQGTSAVNMPYYAYAHNQQIVPGSVEPTGGSSPTGIVFYNGSAYPAAYDGAMLFTDYSRKQIYIMYKGANGLPDPATRQIFRTLPNSAVDLIQGTDGAIYYTDFYNGRVTRIAYNGSGAMPTTGKLSGAIIGTPGASGHPGDDAFDGDFASYFASTSTNDGWIGLDLGDARWVRQIKFAPRVGQTTAMIGGVFQGSNDPDFVSGVIALHTVTAAPTAGVLTSVDVNPTGVNYRYVRYVGANGTSSSIAEIEFHAGGGLPATYYNNVDFTGATVTRTDPTVNFTWGIGAPASGIAADRFSVRWQGKIQAIEAGTYTFRTTSDDGVRLWVNNQLLIDEWAEQADPTHANTITLAVGQIYDIRIDYFENLGAATMQVEWQRPGGSFEVVPTSALFANGPSGNLAPVPTIVDPLGSLNWKVGDVISFSGSAVDAEDGDLAPTSLLWSLVLIHGNLINPANTHEHLIQTFNGVAGGTFVAPDHEYPSWIELRLTATDLANRSTTVVRRINPLTTTVTLNSTPAGAAVTFGGTSGTTPLTSTLLTGSTATISTPSQIISGGKTYLFASWSDGGALTHDIIAPLNDSTITANYVLAPAPVAPTLLVAATQSSTSIKLTWVDNASNETGYRINRRPPGGTFAPLITVAANITVYDDIGLAAGAAYEYRVVATGESDDSESSNIATATTLTILTPPPTPTTLAASLVTTTSATLTWNDIAGNETGYRVERRIVGGTFAPVATLAANSTSFGDTGLAAGTAYEYRVMAFNPAGDSASSNVVAVTTLSAQTVPLAPTNLAAVVQAGSRVQLTWTDTSSNETSFVIQRRYAGWIWGDVGTAAANSTAFLDTTSIGNVTYEYRVIAKNAVGSSDFSNGVLVNTAATTTTTPPATPTNLVAIALTGTRVDLSWTDVATDETAYKIERRLAGGTWAQINQTAANAVSYSDTGVTPGNSYEYRVRAARNTTDSAYGNTATATTPGAGSGIPNAPSNFTAVVTTKPRVQLNWVDNSTNETAFIVQRRYTGWIWGDVGTVGPNITSFLDTTGIRNVMYEYRVVAQGAGGSSPFSNSVIVNTL